MDDFAKTNFNDAEVTSVRAEGSRLIVRYRDWKELERELVFSDVVGYQWFSPEGKSLSHGLVEHDADFIRQACLAAEDDPEAGFVVYSLVCAWTDEKILRVVARGVATAVAAT